MSSNTSSKTMSDASSIHSTVSNATTLKDAPTKNKKWYSLSSKTSNTSIASSLDPKNNNIDKKTKQKLLHQEAIATYLALR
ncbi:uncharacterized protein N7529_003012 [Penicillium soppii]|uniref:uncharacterized protein n=1 Tax=Penicillium soppii TaxID=69789 RepID=UPI0025465C70|nr:uncharacterized protein N7529_003012 [Penicillium soppii]KAJ5874582.1 hypothetical protein N7529_003012 [Penicillium soppii]